VKTHPGKTAHASQQGFTLIEVLIAVAILTIGLLAAGVMQMSALRGNANAKQLFRSAVWSADRFEQLLDRPFNDDWLRPNPPDRPEPIANDPDPARNRLNFTDEPGRLADHRFVDAANNLTLFWNVANDYPVRGCTTIRVIVRRFDQGLDTTQAREMTMDFVRLTRSF